MFWIHASNTARFEQSYREIANCVKIPGRQSPKADIFELVYNWLRDAGKGKTLLILDNVDDARFLLEPRGDAHDAPTSELVRDSRPLVSYLPQNVSVLVTTRGKDAALKLVEQRDIIAVEPMDNADSRALLEKKLGHQIDRDNITKLATMLEFMPLAMVQAAAYISHRAPRCSVQQYLDKFQRNDNMKTSLLDFEGGQLRRDWEAKNSVIITWQISFDHLREIRPSAADLLSLMSFFDRQGIPDALLRIRRGQKNKQQSPKGDKHVGRVNDDSSEDDDSGTGEDDEFEEDISILRDYSFVTPNGSNFEMHGLVQLATRKWLQVQGSQERWRRQFIMNICAEFPMGHYENWAKCRPLFPHVKSAAEQKPEEQKCLEDWTTLMDWATLMDRAGYYAWKTGDIPSAMEMSVKALEVRYELIGQKDLRTLSTMSLVARLYSTVGRLDKEEELLLQVLKICKRFFGLNYRLTLVSMNNLSVLYRDQGRWEESHELNMQVVETCKIKLGLNHPDTLSSMVNLAHTLKDQRRDVEAISLMTDCVQRKRRVFPDKSPSVIRAAAVLAEWEAEQVENSSSAGNVAEEKISHAK